jgi:uncharacterized membrane protein
MNLLALLISLAGLFITLLALAAHTPHGVYLAHDWLALGVPLMVIGIIMLFTSSPVSRARRAERRGKR